MSTIVCLVSRQSMANVIPVLELHPSEVILLRTKQESKVALNIQRLFVSKNIKTRIYKSYIDPYDLETVKSACRDIINESETNIILNVTGGTKTMAIAAYEIFKSSDKRILYYDPIHHIIINMNPIGVENSKVNLKIKIKDYLLAHGYEIINENTLSGRAESKKDFISILSQKRFDEFLKFYSEVRANTALNKPRFDFVRHKFKFNKSMDKITIIDEMSKLKISTSHSNFNFGDWLEDILYLKLKGLPLDDIKYSVKILKDNVKSEIDVLLTKDCKLYLYSCKDKNKVDKFDLFEIEILRNIAGGTFGKAHFVFTKDDEYIERVASNLNIDVIKITDYFNN